MTDDRTNSLLVLASRSSLEDIRELVKQLDVPLVGGGRIHVYYLKHADSEELSNTLSSMLSGRGGASSGGPGRSGNAGNVAQNLRSQVTELAEGITLSADAATNSLVIQASKEAYEILVDVIQKLDIERPQVLVEALILTVDITDNLELGMDWAVQVANADQEFAFGTAARAGAAATGASGVNEIFGMIQNGFSRDATTGAPTSNGVNVNAILSAQANNGNVNIVSAPHILTSDNEEAEIKIGDNIPIITSRVDSATGNTQGLASSVNVERQDIGVTLRVTPQISEGDTLRLKIFQQIEEIATALQASVGSAESVGVALSNRKVENTVVVSDGETVVIGGLISDKEEDSETKVPFLGDIPGLGWAFKTRTKSIRKVNLMIFLTPHIIRSDDDLEYATIRQRGKFEDELKESYSPGEGTLEALGPDEDNPVTEALQEHSEKYPVRRKAELDAAQNRLKKEKEEMAKANEAQQRTRYLIRAKAFKDEGNATKALTQMMDAGYEGSLVSSQSGTGLTFELYVGPYVDLDRARSTANVLTETYGFSPSIVVVERPQKTESGTEVEDAGSEPTW